MGKKEKLRLKLEVLPKDFTWDELVTLLRSYKFEVISGSGSRYKFYHKSSGRILSFHKPHPSNVVKEYVLKETRQTLNEIEQYE